MAIDDILTEINAGDVVMKCYADDIVLITRRDKNAIKRAISQMAKRFKEFGLDISISNDVKKNKFHYLRFGNDTSGSNPNLQIKLDGEKYNIKRSKEIKIVG